MVESDQEFVERLTEKFFTNLEKGDVRRLSALARRGAKTQWRPIETAPKDGTEVFLYLADADEVIKSSWAPQGDWWGISEFTPTHWMPLPPPPALGEPDHE